MSRGHFWRSISRDTNVEVSALGVRSLLHRVFPSNVLRGKENRLRADKNESRSLLAVDIQGHRRGGFFIRRSISSLSSLSLKCATRESGCRIGYEPAKMIRDMFWRSISRDTNVEVSALGVRSLLHRVFPSNVLRGKVVAESVTSRQK